MLLPQVSGDTAEHLAASRYGMLCGAGVVGVIFIIRNLLAITENGMARKAVYQIYR